MPKAKLTPIPRRAKAKPPAGATSAAEADGDAPDLSHMAEALRPLAVPIGGLRFDPANAVKHDEANLDGIRGSLHVYGQCKPVVVRKDTGAVIAGNGTLAAALSLGWTHLAAVYVEMDAATAVGYSIADNRTSDLHSWDAGALDKLLREVNTGNDERLDAMIAELAKEEKIVPPEGKAKDDGPAGEEDPDRRPARITCPSCGHNFDDTIRVTEEPPDKFA